VTFKEKLKTIHVMPEKEGGEGGKCALSTMSNTTTKSSKRGPLWVATQQREIRLAYAVKMKNKSSVSPGDHKAI
jgi:hypothetical protein